MVYFLFEHDRDGHDAAVYAPRKAAPATPRHQLQLHEYDAHGASATFSGWKPHLLPVTHASERHPRTPPPPPAAPEHEREHPHQWRDAVIHAKHGFDA